MDHRKVLLLLAVVLLAIFAPSVLGGIALFFLYAILGIILLGVVLMLALRLRVRKMQREMNGRGFERNERREGEVKVNNTEAHEKRIRRDVGDYVEFEEITEEKDV
jgi:uncharacterized protein (DUF58 family)